MYDVISDIPAVLLNYAEFFLKSGRVVQYSSLLSQNVLDVVEKGQNYIML